MTSLFDDWYANTRDEAFYDPVAAARLASRRHRPKRFYASAGTAAGEGGFALTLDGKPARTPAKNLVRLPTAALGAAVAAEWAGQGDEIDPAGMALTRLANTIIDGVLPSPTPVADEIVRYAGSDLLCYRADAPASLVARQAAHWDPVLAFARDALDARLILSEGIVFVAQPETAIAAVRRALPTDSWRLGALHVVTTLTGSALLALALDRNAFDPEAIWTAAHVDEDHQIAQWGPDEEAAARRAFRRREFDAAVLALALL